jgi:23S rRNA-/tRNA-specific pseudouridylate synthase
MIAVAPEEAERFAARPARTRWEPLSVAGDVTLLRVIAHTGRMHQVRAHLAAAGHPLVGDALYGGPPPLDGAPGHLLHASRLALPHPSGGRLEVRAPLPPAREAALSALGLRW